MYNLLNPKKVGKWNKENKVQISTYKKRSGKNNVHRKCINGNNQSQYDSDNQSPY